MKRAKIALVAIALLAIAGGSLAFKAQRITDKIYVTTTAGATATVTVLGHTLTEPFPGATPAGFAYATTIYSSTASPVLVPYYTGQ